MPDLAPICFWCCIAGVLYAYAGYPILIWLCARLFGRAPMPPAGDDWPTVTLLIVAYNEAMHIEKRVRNALDLDYPADRLDIVIASDGSTDATTTIVQALAHPRIRLLPYAERRGKPAVLNAVWPELTGELIVLSDANSFTERGAVRNLVRWFRTPQVGVVCGRLVLTDPLTGRNVDSLYWKYETFLKKCESRLGALLGSNGAIYAIRRTLFASIPRGTINDDFIIPLRAKLNTGCQIIYDRDAVAVEETPEQIGAEFRRRTRIGAGGFQSIGLLMGLLHPRHGWVAFAFLSHKVLRWLCPFLLIGALVTNLALLDRPEYQLLLAAQATFYTLALVGAWLPATPRVLRYVRLATMFTSMNLALLVGFCNWCRGSQRVAWERTERTTAESA